MISWTCKWEPVSVLVLCQVALCQTATLASTAGLPLLTLALVPGQLQRKRAWGHAGRARDRLMCVVADVTEYERWDSHLPACRPECPVVCEVWRHLPSWELYLGHFDPPISSSCRGSTGELGHHRTM